MLKPTYDQKPATGFLALLFVVSKMSTILVRNQ